LAFEFEKIWKTVRLKGPKLALMALISALAFAIANKLADNALTNVVDRISALVSPPTFFVVFSEPINTNDLQLLEDGQKPLTDIKVITLGERAVRISVAPGYYLLKLYRHQNEGKYVLNAPLNLRANSGDYSIDVSETRWALETATTHIEGADPGDAPSLVGTRWITSKADWDIAASASSKKQADILKTALGQVGVNAKGSEADKAAILDYFKETTFPNPKIEIPWGGAFLNWVMAKSSVPGTRSAAFASWLNYGEQVPIGSAEPGMITIFDFPGLPQAPSRLLVGIFLRQTQGCTEIIAGNIADRVVITCVKGAVKMVRKPGEA